MMIPTERVLMDSSHRSDPHLDEKVLVYSLGVLVDSSRVLLCSSHLFDQGRDSYDYHRSC